MADRQRYKYEVEGLDIDRLLAELPNDIGRAITTHVFGSFWKINEMEFWHALKFERLAQDSVNRFCSLLSPIVIRKNGVQQTPDNTLTAAAGLVDAPPPPVLTATTGFR